MAIRIIAPSFFFIAQTQDNNQGDEVNTAADAYDSRNQPQNRTGNQRDKQFTLFPKINWKGGILPEVNAQGNENQ